VPACMTRRFPVFDPATPGFSRNQALWKTEWMDHNGSSVFADWCARYIFWSGTCRNSGLACPSYQRTTKSGADRLVEQGELKAWFCREVLPLEPSLMRFIRRNWRNGDETADIRQDVYARVLEGASRGLPTNVGGYVFTTAKNVMINRARSASVVSIELVAEIENVMPGADWLTPERHLDGRRTLRRVIEAIENLPPRCREVIHLRKVEGLTTREVAERLGVGVDAVQQQTMLGMRAVTDFMLGGEGRINRPAKKLRRNKGVKS